VNKLVSVRPLTTRYSGHIGDVVVGRVVEVADKRWRLDINSRQFGALLLSSVNLPGGVQRRRTDADSLQMRSLYAEDDLVSAEVQQIHQTDGGVTLHTRSLKYGKLENGVIVTVPAALIKRAKQHFHALSCGVDVILGLNGYIWLSANPEADAKERASEAKGSKPSASASASAAAAAPTATATAASTAAAPPPDATDTTSRTIRERIARVRNSILALAAAFLPISSEAVMDVYDESVGLGLQPKQMLSSDDVVQTITQSARQAL